MLSAPVIQAPPVSTTVRTVALTSPVATHKERQSTCSHLSENPALARYGRRHVYPRRRHDASVTMESRDVRHTGTQSALSSLGAEVVVGLATPLMMRMMIKREPTMRPGILVVIEVSVVVLLAEIGC
jgi:hypothetical protein